MTFFSTLLRGQQRQRRQRSRRPDVMNDTASTATATDTDTDTTTDDSSSSPSRRRQRSRNIATTTTATTTTTTTFSSVSMVRAPRDETVRSDISEEFWWFDSNDDSIDGDINIDSDDDSDDNSDDNSDSDSDDDSDSDSDVEEEYDIDSDSDVEEDYQYHTNLYDSESWIDLNDDDDDYNINLNNENNNAAAPQEILDQLIHTPIVNSKDNVNDDFYCAICCSTEGMNGTAKDASMSTPTSTSCSLPLCGHRYHSCCILQWFERSSSCPMCRRELEFQAAPALAAEVMMAKEQRQ